MRRTFAAAIVPLFLLLGIVSATSASADVVNGGTLTSGQAVTVAVTVPNRNVQYAFAATSGVHVTFDVTATNWGTGGATLRLNRPDGTTFDSCIVTTSPKFCEITPDATGNWQLVLDPGDTSVGSATFTYATDQNKGLLTDGTAVTTTIATRGQNAFYTLAATSGSHVTINITASTWGTGSAHLYIFPPTGSLYSNCTVTTTTICEFYPNATGIWRLQLDPADRSLGSTTFALANDQNKGALTSGTPVTTSIAIRGQNAVYTFTGSSGTHATFDVTATNWGTGGTARLNFYRPSGTLWDYCILNTSPTTCDVTPTVGGTWKVSLDPTDNAVGNATFTYAADQDKGLLTAGTPVTTTIATVNQNANYTFAATSGSHVSIDITAANWGTGSALLYVFPPSGTPLFTHCVDATSTSCEFTPTSTGTWRIELDPQGPAVGNTTFALVNDQNKGALTSGTAITTTIATPGQNAFYTFAGTNGTHVTFDVSATNWGSGGAARLSFYQPDGTLFDYCILTTSPTYCELTPNLTGTWKVSLDPADNAVGATTFTFATDQDKGALTTGTPISTSIAVRGQNANYTFAASSGHLVTINIGASTWGTGSALLYVFPPSGTPLFTHCAVVSGTSCQFTPDSTGNWQLELDPQGDAVGSTTFTKN